MAGQDAQANFSHGPDVLTLLNRDLANELNTMLMYMAGNLMVRGMNAHDVEETAEKFAKQDFKHARKLAARIVDLHGVPQLLPAHLENNASIEPHLPRRGEATPILQEALESEMQSVIEYRNQIQNIGFSDPATRLLLEEILSDKERQAETIRHLLGV